MNSPATPAPTTTTRNRRSAITLTRSTRSASAKFKPLPAVAATGWEWWRELHVSSERRSYGDQQFESLLLPRRVRCKPLGQAAVGETLRQDATHRAHSGYSQSIGTAVG